MLAEDPCVGVDLPRVKRKEMEALSVEECRRFLDVVRHRSGFRFGLSIDERAKSGPLQARTPLAAGREVQRLAQEERWPAEKLVATLLSLAAGSQATNAEFEGVELVRMASSLGDDLAAEWSSLLRWFTAALFKGEGSNHFTANNYPRRAQRPFIR